MEVVILKIQTGFRKSLAYWEFPQNLLTRKKKTLPLSILWFICLWNLPLFNFASRWLSKHPVRGSCELAVTRAAVSVSLADFWEWGCSATGLSISPSRADSLMPGYRERGVKLLPPLLSSKRIQREETSWKMKVQRWLFNLIGLSWWPAGVVNKRQRNLWPSYLDFLQTLPFLVCIKVPPGRTGYRETLFSERVWNTLLAEVSYRCGSSREGPRWDFQVIVSWNKELEKEHTHR